MHAPQIIMIVLWSLTLFDDLAHHGEYTEPRKRNFFGTLIAVGLSVGLLWWGGFFG